jgi:DNA polymerase III delta subunit
MIIIHGVNQVLAQQKLDQLINQAKKKNLQIEREEAKNLSPAKLTQLLNPSSLFSDSRFILIENLLSFPQSKNKKKLLDILKKNQSQDESLVLLENKDIHAATIKSLSPSAVHHFKSDPLIFKFLDSLQPQKPKQSLEILQKMLEDRQSLEMLFFMLIRHIRQLIQVKTPGSLRMAPWQLKKLSNQSSAFSQNQLIALHEKLYLIDKRQKTSKVKDLRVELEHLVVSLSDLR